MKQISGRRTFGDVVQTIFNLLLRLYDGNVERATVETHRRIEDIYNNKHKRGAARVIAEA